MKGSRLPGEGGDRQRHMGSPGKGPRLKMDREVFVEGPLGFYPSALVRGWSLFWVRGTERDRWGRRWCLEWLWAALDPPTGCGPQ